MIIKIFKFIRRAILALYNRFLIIYNPECYARKIGVKIGKNVKFYGMTPGMFGSEPWLISLGDDVHIVSGCNFITHDGGVLILRKDYPELELTKPIKIGNNVYIGMNCTVLPGVCIGNNVIIGASSVVTKDIPSNTVFAGVPAKFIKTIDNYLDKAQKDSLGFGYMNAKEKECALKEYYGVVSDRSAK